MCNARVLFIILSVISSIICTENKEYCELNDHQCNESIKKHTRYLFYDVNPPEGFNLRRDVYMRFAVFAHNFKKSPKSNLSSFKLVLPPWPSLYHWHTWETLQIPWSYFFDIPSLQRFVPVIEMHQFFYEVGVKYSRIKIDEVYVLQHFEEMFKTGVFEDKMEIQPCSKPIQTNFYEYDNVTSDNIKCLSFHGHTMQLLKILEQTGAKSIFFDHAEVALHDSFGSKIYWKARRSMRFNKELQKEAARYRKNYLNSTDELDNTLLPEDWRDEKPSRTAKGGPYLAVHLRQRDFAYGRPNDVPDIKSAAKQIRDLSQKLQLRNIFIATDTSTKEYNELQRLLQPDLTVFKYIPDEDTTVKFTQGQLAIIDQIICSHARYFIGTHESTFSFRIQEEREILGLPIDSSFNRLCGKSKKCEKPTRWTIVY